MTEEDAMAFFQRNRNVLNNAASWGLDGWGWVEIINQVALIKLEDLGLVVNKNLYKGGRKHILPTITPLGEAYLTMTRD